MASTRVLPVDLVLERLEGPPKLPTEIREALNQTTLALGLVLVGTPGVSTPALTLYRIVEVRDPNTGK